MVRILLNIENMESGPGNVHMLSGTQFFQNLFLQGNRADFGSLLTIKGTFQM